MPMARDMLRQLEQLLMPIANRIANVVARGVLEIVDDATKGQLLQLGVMDDEPVDEVERIGQYGFTSIPLEGAEAVVVFPNGDRVHGLCVAIDDRRHRPTGGVGGEVVMYSDEGDSIALRRTNLIIVTTSSKIKLGSAAASDPVALKSDLDALKSWLDGHIHPDPVSGNTLAPTTPSPTATGATKVDAE